MSSVADAGRTLTASQPWSAIARLTNVTSPASATHSRTLHSHTVRERLHLGRHCAHSLRLSQSRRGRLEQSPEQHDCANRPISDVRCACVLVCAFVRVKGPGLGIVRPGHMIWGLSVAVD